MKESGEMYLESIYVLSKKKAYVRSIDIAEYMNFSKPSVSRGVGLLKKEGHIEVDKNGYITLTPYGAKKAESIFERHSILTDMLMFLGVDEETASNDACRMEHIISDQTFEAMKNHLEKYKK